jgi:hypothetical protein
MIASPKSKVRGPRSGPVKAPRNSPHATRHTPHALAAQLPVIPDASDIRDIKPPVELPNEWLWLWIALAVVLAGALAGVVWFLMRKKAAMPPPVLVLPPHVRAKQRLAEALMFLSDPNKFCTVVSDTARLYLEERFTLRAPERTTEEFLVELRTSPHLTLDQKQSLGAFLESCDLVKFARFEPTETTLRQLHDAALRLVDETQFDPISAAPTAGTATANSQ